MKVSKSSSGRTIFRFFCFWLFIIVPLVPVLGEYNPPAGGEEVYEFFSPYFLSLAKQSTVELISKAGVLNPASIGREQRIAIDLSYLGLIGFESAVPDNTGYKGHGVNIGGTLPTNFGVISGGISLLHSPFPSMELGTFTNVHVSFAKELFEEIYVGTGAEFTLGNHPSNQGIDTGFNADIGFIRHAGDVGVFRDLRWGAVFRNLGSGYKPIESHSAFPSVFTPSMGVSFDVFEAEQTKARLYSEFSLPSMRNLKLEFGGEIFLRDSLRFQTALRVDAQQLFNGTIDNRIFLPSFGFTVNVSPGNVESEEDRWAVTSNTAVAPFYDGIWGYGVGVNLFKGKIDIEPPLISVVDAMTYHISPNNDGLKDMLELEVHVEDSSSIAEFAFEVTDKFDNRVSLIQYKEKRPEIIDLNSFFRRLFYADTGISIPDRITWDCRNEDGLIVPDGSYQYLLEAVDLYGNRTKKIVGDIVIDTRAPEIKVKDLPDDQKIFSPNGDGNKDFILIEQSGSEEQLWIGEIKNTGGQSVFKIEWINDRPDDFRWTGRTSEDEVVPDGVYSYEIRSTDPALNSAKSAITNIIKNTDETPLTMAIDPLIFSPNGDGKKDGLTFRFSIPVKIGVKDWALSILDSNNRTVRTIRGEDEPPPETLYFDGRDENRRYLREGEYFAKLSIRYLNGNNPEAESPTFLVDVTPPQAAVSIDSSVFSPNGDGKKDSITFFQEATSEELWKGIIADADGRTIKEFEWYGGADSKIQWFGTTSEGRRAKDGKYTYHLESTDLAGNRGQSRKVFITLDTEQTPIIFTAEFTAFSPNADGIKDRIRLIPELAKDDEIDRYTVTIKNANDQMIRSFSGVGRLPAHFEWDGLTGEGERAEDGTYRAVLDVLYENGNNPVSLTSPFTLDTVAPEATVSIDLNLFSPNNDGIKDRITISQTSTGGDVWRGIIRDESGSTVRTFVWNNRLETLYWGGKDIAGNTVPDGTYSYTISSVDAAGNRFEITLSNIRVDTKKTPLFITVDSTSFSPNGDGFKDEISFTLYTTVTEGISDWSLAIFQENGTLQERISGISLDEVEKISWKGSDEKGFVREGTYYALFNVKYNNGNSPSVRSANFRIDTTGPRANISLRPLPFASLPEQPTQQLNIYLEIDDASEIAQWRFDIFDPNETPFVRLSGDGMPPPVQDWNGRSAWDELVLSFENYSYLFVIADALGNISERTGEIPVGIVVNNDDVGYTLEIPGLNFKDNGSVLISGGGEEGAENNEIFQSLANMLKTYNNYKVIVLGHALNLSGTREEEIEELIPLTIERAQSVKEELVRRGIAEDRISAEGRGGTKPRVAHSDENNRWKNERIEIILTK